MVLNLSAHNLGENSLRRTSSHERRGGSNHERRSTSSGRTSIASSLVGTMNSSKSHHTTGSSSMDGSSSSHHSFGAIISAAKFSKKLIAKRMSAMSESSRNRSDTIGDSSSRRSHHSDGSDRRRRNRESLILQDPHRHLKTIITTESSPFLSQFMDYPIPAPSMARANLLLGKLLQDGDFARIQEVTGFKSRNPQQRQHPYAIKSINPRLLHPAESSQLSEDDDEGLERAVTKLVLEGLYLGHLQHAHILKLRGVAMGGMAAEPEALFLLTDRLGDTLDQRLDTWKQWAAAKEKLERKRQRRVQYPPLAPSTMGVVSMGVGSSADHNNPLNVLNDQTIQTYPEDLIVLKTNYALQILDALQYLHERGIVVRELRPESIGFCAYPHHHTVQLCDLSSCKEVPRDGSQIPPEVMHTRPSLLDVSQLTHDTTTRDETQSSQGSNGGMDNSEKDGCCSTNLLGVRTGVPSRRYMAPEVFGDDGYNTKADIYSWAMVFSELVTEAKPYSSRQLVRDWAKIVKGELRPKLQKYHFPRTIKAILEQAWQANVSRRATARQLHKSLTTVLHMLEGQGLPWLVDPQSTTNATSNAVQKEAIAAAVAATNGATTAAAEGQQQQQQPPQRTPSRRSRMNRQKTLTRQSMTLAAQSAVMRGNHSRGRSISTSQGPTLPQRAAKYKKKQAKEPIGWGQVWDPRATDGQLDGNSLLKSVQKDKAQVFQKRFKANRIEGI